MDMIQLGRLALPIVPLLLFAAVAAALAVARFGAGGQRGRVEAAIFNVALAGVLGARFGFVLSYWDAFQSAPLSILDVRDRGFLPWPGIACAGAAAAAYLAALPQLRRPLAIALASGASTLALGMLLQPLLPQQARMPAPTVPFAKADGGTLSLDAFRGKPLVVNLWATWCPPCRREMPLLQRMQQQRSEIAFAFADQGEPAELVTRYLAEQGLRLQNVILDPHQILARNAGSTVLPITLVFDRNGELRAKRAGQLSEATLAQLLERAGR